MDLPVFSSVGKVRRIPHPVSRRVITVSLVSPPGTFEFFKGFARLVAINAITILSLPGKPPSEVFDYRVPN